MILVIPLLWLLGWLVVAGLVGAFSGLAPRGAGTAVFLGLFLGGSFGLPLVGLLIRAAWRAVRER